MNRGNEKRGIRVAFVFNHAFFLGGGERSFFELIRSLDQEVFASLVIAPADGAILDACGNLGLRTVVCPMPPLKHAIASLSSALRMARRLAASRVDIIHANGSRACFYCLLAGNILRVPVIWHVRETLRDIRLYDGLLLCLSRSLICVSESVRKKRFSAFPRALTRKIRVVHNGVDPLPFRPGRPERDRVRKGFGVEEGQVLFGLVANFVPLKAQDVFLRAVAYARNLRPHLPVRVLMIGRVTDRDYHKELLGLIRDLGLTECVILSAYTQDIAEVYASLDVFVLPSRREGFSRSLIEAMCSGLPVLARDLEEISEAVEQGREGLLVDMDDLTQVSRAILRLVEEPALRRGMGEAGRRTALQRFTLREHVQAVQSVYREAIHGH
jgi:glycosyltransferase involved in cell wall biosynthesis